MTAVQTVLNDSDIPLWQVPRDAYRQVIASMADLELNLTSSGPLGARPYGELESANQELNALGVPTGETFVLGDSPLVLLTALLTAIEPDPASSASVQVPAPVVGDDGNYVPGDNSRQPNRRRKDIRVFTRWTPHCCCATSTPRSDVTESCQARYAGTPRSRSTVVKV